MKIDLHIHVKKTSKCAKLTFPILIPSLKEKGIHGASIFDHFYFTTDEDVETVRQLDASITVFKGMEISIKGKGGNREDFVLVSSMAPKTDFRHSDISNLKELMDYLKESDALTILAHPFRRRDFVDFDFNTFVPDCVEIASIHVAKENQQKITDLAKQYGMRSIATSDSHKVKSVGSYYTEIPDGVKTCEELKYILKSGRYLIHL